MTTRNSGVPVSATGGLLLAWALHDAEEWFTIGPWARDRGLPVSDGLARTAIVVMGGIVAAAAVDGARSGGRSPLYQAALLGFGAHGFTHLATSVAVRGYSPGVATVPVTVLPFWLWASRELSRGGVRRPARELGGAAAGTVVGAMALSYGVAALLQRAVRHRSR